MERPLAVAALVLLLGIIGVRFVTELRALGARNASYLVVAALVGAVLLGLGLAISDSRFAIPLVVAFAVLSALWLRPLRLISWTGGPTPLVGLAKAHDELRRMTSTVQVRDAAGDTAAVSSIRSHLDALSRWEAPETSEYIRLVREVVESWLGGDAERDDGDNRGHRMDELEQAFMNSLRARGIDISKVARTRYW